MALGKVRKRGGGLVPFDEGKIAAAVEKAIASVKGKDGKNARSIAKEVAAELAKKFSAKIPSVEDVQDEVEEALIKKGLADVAKSYILYRQKHRELREEKRFFGVQDELKLTVNAVRVLEKRYLIKDEEGNVVETPAQLFRRIAKTVAAPDSKFGGDAKRIEEEFYGMLSRLEFLPNSPTLMNAGTRLAQLSACFVLPVEDSLDSIFDAVKAMALIHQSGGGTGFSFSRLRPAGDVVGSTRGISSGPVSFMRVFDATTDVIRQGGCIATGTLVRTDAGVERMGKFLDCPSMGENFARQLVYSGDGFHSALLAQDNGNTEVLRIRTELGTELEATYNHAIRIVDENGGFAWRAAGELREGDWVVHVLGGHCGSDFELQPLGKAQHFNASRLSLPKTMNPELGELLGIYVADGCTSSGGRIIFAVEKSDAELRKRIESLMLELFGIKLGHVEEKEDDKSLCLVFYSADLIRYFERMGWKKSSSLEAYVPDSIFKSSAETARGFVRGLFEGDGDIHPDGYPRFYSASRRLALELQQLLLGLGIVSGLHNYNCKNRFGRGPMWNLVIVQDRSIWEFAEKVGFMTGKKNLRLWQKMRSKRWEMADVIPNQGALLRSLYGGPGRGSGPGRGKRGADRKLYRTIQHYVDGVSAETKRNLTRTKLRMLLHSFEKLRNGKLIELADDKYFYSRVVSIEKSRAHTMDVEVPTAESFVANGILVHNRRRGANMGILAANHPDIIEFITSKSKPGFLTNFNISVAATDEFMKAVEKNGEYALVNPRNGKIVKRLRAADVFSIITTSAWATGDPGLVFIDEINRLNPTAHIGKIESTNPCGEQPLHPYESCNLGSINLMKMMKGNWGKFELDWEKLTRAVGLAVRFLDNVVEANKYPLPQIEKITRANRRIGLGVMGFADSLLMLGIPYDSEEALAFAEKLMKFISDEAVKSSEALAKERGAFLNWKGSPWEKRGKKVRNATITTIAPTGTISIAAGCSSGIEPLFALAFVRNVMEGTRLLEINPIFERTARERGFYSAELMRKIARSGSVQGIAEVPEDVRRLFVTAMDIAPEWHVRMQAAFQKYTDNAVSKTVNLPSTASVADVERIYKLAYKLKCKGITVYRYGSKSEQVLYVGSVSGEKGDMTGYITAEAEYAGGCPAPVCSV